MKKIIIFASGNGSNAENIMRYFDKSKNITVVNVFTNNANAGVIEKAKLFNVPITVIDKTQLNDNSFLLTINKWNPDLIVLAGFLLLFPATVIKAYPKKIINIHPALLPKYGGKGMYGLHIHQAVLANREKESGITIHYVNEQYDEGEYILQQKTSIESCKTAEEIGIKILELEHELLPKTIEKLITSY